MKFPLYLPQIENPANITFNSSSRFGGYQNQYCTICFAKLQMVLQLEETYTNQSSYFFDRNYS
jgi:hypothetical protein